MPKVTCALQPALLAFLVACLLGARGWAQSDESQTGAVGSALQPPAAALGARSNGSHNDELARLFTAALETIEAHYVGPIDKQRLAEVALQAMLRDLDANSDFIGPNQWPEFRDDVVGEYEGVGLQLTLRQGKVTALAPTPHSPAESAGVAAGDQLLAIDGLETAGMSLDQAVARLSINTGDSVEVVVSDPASGQPRALTLPRAKVQRCSVWGWGGAPDAEHMWCDVEHRIGYLRIAFFGKHTAGQFREAVLHLVQANAAGLVVDLRGNPGGLLASAVEVADLFIEQGALVAADRRDKPRQVWRAHQPGTVRNLPLAVLVDGDTASASEVLAACLQDHRRATLVGLETYGKRTVQNVFELQPGQAAVKLTTAYCVRPSQALADPPAAPSASWRIAPDVLVELPGPERRALLEDFAVQDVIAVVPPHQSTRIDRQLQRAIQEVLARPAAEPMSINPAAPPSVGGEAMEQSLLTRPEREKGAAS